MISEPVSEGLSGESSARRARFESLSSIWNLAHYAIYALALVISISIWFVAIRAPLTMDETISYCIIKGRFLEILSRQGWPGVPAYSYILWLWTRIFGTSEIALRFSSILAMLGAAYLFYRVARELFDWDVANIALILFSVHPIVLFAAIDVRPYAFAALAINAALFVLVRLRQSDSNWLAALFGILCACIVYFHFLMIVVLPALAICFIAFKIGDRKAFWCQAGIALGAFALAFLPVIPGLLYMFHTSRDHVFDTPPGLSDLRETLAPTWLLIVLAVPVVIAAVIRKLDLESRFQTWRILLCASLALLPILILYGVSVATPIHVFVIRYRLVSIAGYALFWAFVLSRIDSRILRLLFSIAIVANVGYQAMTFPKFKQHLDTWKYALEAVDRNSSVDNAPVLICSDLPEADHMPIPVGEAIKDSNLFPYLTYYKVSAPVVGLPRALNDDAIRIASNFLADAARRRQRFLFLAYFPSYPTIRWFVENAQRTHSARALGDFGDFAVLEFSPRAAVNAADAK